MEFKANITKSENLFSARASNKANNNNNNNNNNNISLTRENTFNSTRSAAKKSNLKSKSTNEFNELPKHVLDERKIQAFQTEMHRKIIGWCELLFYVCQNE